MDGGDLDGRGSVDDIEASRVRKERVQWSPRVVSGRVDV